MGESVTRALNFDQGAAARLVGQYFVNVAIIMFGGAAKVVADPKLYGMIDVVDIGKRRLLEVKASNRKGNYPLRTHQNDLHARLSEHKTVVDDLFSEHKLDLGDFERYHLFFTHGVKNICTQYNSKTELFNALGKNIDSLLILSSDIVGSIHYTIGDSKSRIKSRRAYQQFADIEDEQNYVDYYHDFKRIHVNMLFKDPESVLRMMNLAPNDYMIKSASFKYGSCTFPGCSILSNKCSGEGFF